MFMRPPCETLPIRAPARRIASHPILILDISSNACTMLCAERYDQFTTVEEDSMAKRFRSRAIYALGVTVATLSMASAQTYTTVDFPGATTTVLSGGPNPQDTFIGAYVDTSGVQHGFTLKKGVFTSFDAPASTATTPNWISPEGVIVGSYLDLTGSSHGFILKGGTYTTLDFPGAAGTVLSSVNPSGEMSGATCVVASCGSGVTHSFVVSKKGAFTSFEPPGAVSSSTSTVIPSGAVFGSYTDSGGVLHGYLLDHGTYTTIDFPGAILTFVGAGNPEREAAGEWVDTAGIGHSFLWSNGTFTSFDPPGAVFFSGGFGINPSVVIVGGYADSAGVTHGYIRTP